MLPRAISAECIAGLLLDEWDPIGLKSMGGPNPYHGQACEIVLQFSDAPDECAFFGYFKNACQKRMGLGLNNVDWSKIQAIAEPAAALLNGEN